MRNKKLRIENFIFFLTMKLKKNNAKLPINAIIPVLEKVNSKPDIIIKIQVILIKFINLDFGLLRNSIQKANI